MSILVKPSRWLWRLEWALHLLLFSLIVWTLWPWGLAARCLSLLTGVALGIHLLYRYRHRSDAAGCLEFVQGQWFWRSSTASPTAALALVPASDFIVWPALIVLPLRSAQTSVKCTLVLLPDSAAAEDLRRLRVLLLSRVWCRIH